VLENLQELAASLRAAFRPSRITSGEHFLLRAAFDDPYPELLPYSPLVALPWPYSRGNFSFECSGFEGLIRQRFIEASLDLLLN
jgi:hypothetical protein